MQNSADILNQLRAFQSSRRKPQDILAEEETKLGLPSATQRLTGLRSAIGNTENLLRNVDPSVTGRTSGTFTTEAQRQRLVAKEREPISDQFREQSRALEGETANISDISGRALKSAQLGLSDLDSQENSLRTLYGSLYQREQDEVTRQERERAFQEEQRRRAAGQAAQNAYLRYMQEMTRKNTGASTPTPAVIEPRNISKNKQGQVLGYDEFNKTTGQWGLSRQTDEGWKEQEAAMKAQQELLRQRQRLQNPMGTAFWDVLNAFGIR